MVVILLCNKLLLKVRFSTTVSISLQRFLLFVFYPCMRWCSARYTQVYGVYQPIFQSVLSITYLLQIGYFKRLFRKETTCKAPLHRCMYVSQNYYTFSCRNTIKCLSLALTLLEVYLNNV